MNPTTCRSVPSTRRTVATVSQDWTQYRDTIERLYVTEDRSLPDVVALMKANGFSATERQYKRRITEWNLDKNIKDDEMRAIMTWRRLRQRQGKDSVFYVRGRLVNARKIDRFASRKKINWDDASEPLIRNLPPHVRCITPIHGHLPGPQPQAEDQSARSTSSTSRNGKLPPKESAHARAVEKRLENADAAIQSQHAEAIDDFSFPLVPDHEKRMPPPSFELDQYQLYSASQSQNGHIQVSAGTALSFQHNLDGDGRPPKRKELDINQTAAAKRHCEPTRREAPGLAPTELPWSPSQLLEDAEPTEASKTLLKIKYGNTAHSDPAPETGEYRTENQQQSPVVETTNTLSSVPEPQLKGLLVDNGLPDDSAWSSGGQLQTMEHTSPTGITALQRRPYRLSNSVRPNGLDRETYYASTIAVTLSSLPYSLWQRPRELFYFHFFIDNTARLLSAHDCVNNDFRNLLPRLALQDEALLGLLLEYSARHRACLFGHPLPLHMLPIFLRARESMRKKVDDAKKNGTRSIHSLAMVIMMASMNIVCDAEFENGVPWRDSLQVACTMSDAVDQSLVKGNPGSSSNQQEMDFLNRWLLYLVTMDRLSGSFNVVDEGASEATVATPFDVPSPETAAYVKHSVELEQILLSLHRNELYQSALNTTGLLVPADVGIDAIKDTKTSSYPSYEMLGVRSSATLARLRMSEEQFTERKASFQLQRSAKLGDLLQAAHESRRSTSTSTSSIVNEPRQQPFLPQSPLAPPNSSQVALDSFSDARDYQMARETGVPSQYLHRLTSLSKSPGLCSSARKLRQRQMEEYNEHVWAEHHQSSSSSYPETISPEKTIVENHGPDDKSRGPTNATKVDCVYGCTADLMDVLSAAGRHIRIDSGVALQESEGRIESYVLSRGSMQPLSQTVRRSIGIHSKATIVRHSSGPGRPSPDAVLESIETGAMQMLMSNANMINIFQRYAPLSLSAGLIQPHARLSIMLLDSISPDDRMQPSNLFPLFIAGCETFGEIERQKIRGWFKALEKLGMAQ
ncbi:MAG: hypothetical protein Q9174_004314, partial [Haloplaca sp. 1 TL-2023]